MSIFYLDIENGNDANDGTSFANRWKTITAGATAARIAPGDTIRIMASEDPTSLGINATFTNDSPTITLASALNALITNCDTAWTASANVTCTAYTTFYLTGTGCARQQIAAGFTTGKVAYFGLGGAQNYSTYQGITFGIYCSAAPTDGWFEIRLCSDTVGDVAVDTFVINGVKQLNAWERMYINKGANLGASIQSIALYATADPGTIDVYLDNISTVKAPGNDALNLTTLIGKQNGADGGWYPIRAINGTTVTVDCALLAETASASSAPGFYGTTESVTAYIRKPIRVEVTTTQWATMQEAGTAGNLITYSGGWDRTNMSTQTGDTYVDSGNTSPRFVDFLNFSKIDKLHPMRFGTALYLPSVTDIELGEFRPVGVSIVMYLLGAERLKVTLCAANGCNNVTYGFIGRDIHFTTLTMTNCGSTTQFTDAPLYLGDASSHAINFIIETLTLRGSNSYGMSYTQGARITNLEIWSLDVQYCKGVGTWAWIAEIGMYDYKYGTVNIQNCRTNFYFGGGYGRIGSLTLASPIVDSLVIGNVTANPFYGDHRVVASSISGSVVLASTWLPTDSWLWLNNYNGVADDHRGYYESNGAKAFSELGANRHTPSGIGWRIDCLQAGYSSEFPIRHKITDVVLESGVPSTIRLFVKRSNTGISARLKVYGGEVAGVNETTDTIAVAAGTWEELSITVTPSEYDTVGIWLEVWGGTTYSVYFDDFTVV